MSKPLSLLLALCSPVLGCAAEASAKTDVAKSTAASAQTDVTQLVTEFGSERQSLLSEHKSELERLRAAKTEEERRKILAEVRQRQRERMERQRELIQEKRDQLLHGPRPPAPRPGG